MNPEPEFYMGVDGGGTKCKAILVDSNGREIANTTAGPANVAKDLQGSIESILTAAHRLLDKANIAGLTLADIHVGMGLAGINLPNIKRQFEAQSLPFARHSVTTDLHIACLGAHGGRDGAIAIIGTGSSGIVIRGEEHVEYGGHGFVVGDKGSGAWLGKMAIKHCLETLDGLYPDNELARRIMINLDCKNAHDVVNLTLSAKPAFYATLAPLVLELASLKQHEALILVKEAGEYIDKLCRRLLSHGPVRLSLIGGISYALAPYLSDAVSSHIQPAKLSPEAGAILFLQSTLHSQEQI